MIRRLILTFGILSSTTAFADNLDFDPNSGWYIRPKEVVPIRFVDRPLTLPYRHFSLDLSLEHTSLKRRVPLTVLRGTGGYGVSNELEVGIEVVEWSFSPDPRSGLGAPTAWVAYSLLTGPFSAAAVLEADVPIAGLSAEGRLPMAFRFSPFRLDVTPGVRLAISSTLYPTLTLPLQLHVQIVDTLRAYVGGAVIWDDFVHTRMGVDVFGGLSLSFEDNRGAYLDVRLEVTSPRVAIAGELQAPPALGYAPAGMLTFLFYIFDPPETSRMEGSW